VVTTDKAREQLHNFAEARAGKVIHARLACAAGSKSVEGGRKALAREAVWRSLQPAHTHVQPHPP